MMMSRREFLRASIGVGAVAAIASVGFAKKAEAKMPQLIGRRWIMVIDLQRCDGCKMCTLACQKEHFVSNGQEWMKVYTMEDTLGGEYPLPRPCMNCADAPCVNVCPVEATYHDSDGIVLINHDTCIGCRICMAACPYQARSFNWKEPKHSPEEMQHAYSPEAPWPHRVGTVEKCMFCAHRVRDGKLPACVDACREEMEKKHRKGAIFFGDANEDVVTNGKETLKLSELLKKRQAYRLKEDLGTEPRVIYLPRG